MIRDNEDHFFERTERSAEAIDAVAKRRDEEGDRVTERRHEDKRRDALNYAREMVTAKGPTDVRAATKDAVRTLLEEFGGIHWDRVTTEPMAKSKRWEALRSALVKAGVMSDTKWHPIFCFSLDTWGTWR